MITDAHIIAAWVGNAAMMATENRHNDAGKPNVDVMDLSDDTFWINVRLAYVPNHSNTIFSFDPEPTCEMWVTTMVTEENEILIELEHNKLLFSSERDYIGEDDVAYPAFFCWGEPGDVFPDPGTFHTFYVKDIAGIETEKSFDNSGRTVVYVKCIDREE